MSTLAALITKKGLSIEFIPNPMDRDEAKKILRCQNLGEREIKVVYTNYVLLWDADEPDANSIIPIVARQTSWKPILDKSKCLVCGILESRKIGVKNRFNGCALLVDENS